MTFSSTLLQSTGSYEHFTWLGKIFQGLDQQIAQALPYSFIKGAPVESVSHMFLAGVMTIIVLVLTFRASKAFEDREGSLVPDRSLTARNFVEIIFGMAYGAMVNAMGEKYARRCLPLVATVTFYVFFSNILGLIPGFAPPTENLNATLAPALVVFTATHYYGVREHGVAKYIAHFAGPVWYIAPLYMAIEIVGHLSRVLSLSFRLMGNMIGDHKVIAAFLTLTSMSFFFPVPFWFLGLVVCTMQTLVFALLTIVYIQLAVAHAEH